MDAFARIIDEQDPGALAKALRRAPMPPHRIVALLRHAAVPVDARARLAEEIPSYSGWQKFTGAMPHAKAWPWMEPILNASTSGPASPEVAGFLVQYATAGKTRKEVDARWKDVVVLLDGAVANTPKGNEWMQEVFRAAPCAHALVGRLLEEPGRVVRWAKAGARLPFSRLMPPGAFAEKKKEHRARTSQENWQTLLELSDGCVHQLVYMDLPARNLSSFKALFGTSAFHQQALEAMQPGLSAAQRRALAEHEAGSSLEDAWQGMDPGAISEALRENWVLVQKDTGKHIMHWLAAIHDALLHRLSPLGRSEDEEKALRAEERVQGVVDAACGVVEEKAGKLLREDVALGLRQLRQELPRRAVGLMGRQDLLSREALNDLGAKEAGEWHEWVEKVASGALGTTLRHWEARLLGTEPELSTLDEVRQCLAERSAEAKPGRSPRG